MAREPLPLPVKLVIGGVGLAGWIVIVPFLLQPHVSASAERKKEYADQMTSLAQGVGAVGQSSMADPALIIAIAVVVLGGLLGLVLALNMLGKAEIEEEQREP